MLKNWKKFVFYFPRYCSSKHPKSAESVKELISDKTGLRASTIKELQFETKVPQTPIICQYTKINEEEIDIIDTKTIQLLERLSLVDLDSKEAFKTLQDSIQFANRIVNINTDGIEPLYTVLEDQNLDLREDKITDGNIKKDILRNAKIVEEDYFVAPPGNIPLEQEDKKFE